MTGNVGTRFDRLPGTKAERTADSRPTREAVIAWWEERYGIPPATFEEHSFWERGSGKVWAFRGEAPSPIDVQGLGMHVLRTGGEHWKPTTNAVQRFGERATRNVLVVDAEAAAVFVRGDDQAVEWNGDWGYLIVARELAGGVAPLGVGLYLRGELRSRVPKGRRIDRDPGGGSR
jgi:NOL1/NOP2/fmu family ribosome biogenesis protein